VSIGLAHLPTPLERMERLEKELGGPRLLVKRDDCTGLALGGNKARKLELIVAEAIEAGCDTLVTGGGAQSNHCRLTAAAAAHTGLRCDLAVAGPKTDPSGNLVLDLLLGATLHYTGASTYDEIEISIGALANELTVAGRKPYAIPVGGASTTGVLAYALAIDELQAQLDDPVDWIVVADGSGGTHAGLLAGLGRAHTRVMGVDVGTRPGLDQAVPRLAYDVAAITGREPNANVIVDHEHLGAGYAQIDERTVDVMRTVARTEGIVLDPVYSAKAMMALFDAVRRGQFGANETVLFWHTGGTPAIFAREFERDFL